MPLLGLSAVSLKPGLKQGVEMLWLAGLQNLTEGCDVHHLGEVLEGEDSEGSSHLGGGQIAGVFTVGQPNTFVVANSNFLQIRLVRAIVALDTKCNFRK